MIYDPGWQESLLWIIITAFIVAFILGFAMGANDCANSYGPTVGAGVLKLWHAYLLATVFEIAGAGLLGYQVTETLREGIVNVNIYDVSVQPDPKTKHYERVPNCSSDPHTQFLTTPSPYKWHCVTYTDAVFMVGCLGALIGCGFWLVVATLFKVPVSTTHSTIGATVGFSLVLKGPNGIHWWTIGNIVASWVISPLLAGAFATMFYMAIKLFALNRKDPFEGSLQLLPWLFAFTVLINIFSIIYGGSKYLYFDQLTWWMVLIISVGLGAITGILVQLCLVGRLRKQQEILDRSSEENSSYDDGVTPYHEKQKKKIAYTDALALSKGLRVRHESKDRMELISLPPVPPKYTEYDYGELRTEEDGDDNVNYSDADYDMMTVKVEHNSTIREKLKQMFDPIPEPPNASKVFGSLQILSSIFLSFSHGSNDTANAVGPLVALWVTYKSGYALTESPEYDAQVEGLIIYGASCMIIGLWCFGHKVIQTVGNDITTITPATGFSMQIGTAFTVLLCSKIGIPVSTTHCLIGAIVFVGWLGSRKGVSWKMFGGIAFAWLVTLPVAAGVAALATYLLLFALK